MTHILAVLFGVAAIAIALAARKKKSNGFLPVIGGGACLGLKSRKIKSIYKISLAKLE